MTTYQETIMNEYAKQYASNWFKMNEGSGTTLTDSKGSSVGTATTSSWTSTGYLFTGSNKITLSQNITSHIKFSLSFDIKTTDTSTNTVIIGNANNSSENGILVQLLSGNLMVFFLKSGAGHLVSLGDIAYLADGLYHTVKIIKNGVKVKVYVDGIIKVNSILSQEMNASSSRNLTIGSNPSNTAYIKAEISNLQLYNNIDLDEVFINKTLILNKNEYKTYNSGWQTVSSTTPSESQYLSDGIDDLLVLERKVQSLPPIKMDKSETLLEDDEGKAFAKTIDLKKYADIRSMKVEVK